MNGISPSKNDCAPLKKSWLRAWGGDMRPKAAPYLGIWCSSLHTNRVREKDTFIGKVPHTPPGGGSKLLPKNWHAARKNARVPYFCLSFVKILGGCRPTSISFIYLFIYFFFLGGWRWKTQKNVGWRWMTQKMGGWR